MEFFCLLCTLWTVLHYLIYLIIIVQLIRLIFADGDLTLMFKEKFGQKPASLAGQVVWITGASSGIGEYLAYDLARYNCKLILSARRVDELERVKKTCLTSSQVGEENIKIVPFDLLQCDTHREVAKQALQCFGKIDILVNNSGRSQRSLIKDTDLAVDRAILDLNLVGTISITKAILPHFIGNKKGHILVTSSIAGKIGAMYSSTYSASKFALQGWFETLRIEHANDNIKVTLVCPGLVYSNITQEAFVAEPGKKFDVPQAQGERFRMATGRCSELMVVAMANQLGEVWVSGHPILLLTYMAQYTPDFLRWIAITIGMRFYKKFRDIK